MSLNILLTGGRILDPQSGLDSTGDILITEGRIADISKNRIAAAKDIAVFDARGMIVCPGFIDLHCHLREPGYEDKETIATGSRAAAKGGYTTICCMPNTNPPLDNEATIRYVKEKAQAEAPVSILPIGCITKGREGKELTEMNTLAAAGAIGFSDDGSPVTDNRIMMLAMEYSKYSGLPIMDHCENRELAENGQINEGWVATRLGLRGIPAAAEEINVARDISLARLTGARLHICHASTRGSVQLVRDAKADGLKVTAEVTPNHLLLTEERVMGQENRHSKGLAYDTNAKVNPPLRTNEDIAALIEGLRDGTIDCIATDHAPHALVDKQCEFGLSAFGISSFETAFAGLLSLVDRNLLDLKTLIAALTFKSAAVINNPSLATGSLKKGEEANVTIFNPATEWTVDINNFISKGKNSPYNGTKMKGKVTATIARGEWAFREKSK